MIKIIDINADKLRSISFQTDQAYRALEFALKMRTSYDAFYAVNEFETFRKTLFEGIPLLFPLESLSKNDADIKQLAPYFFQQVIGNEIAVAYKNYLQFPNQRPVNLEMTISDLVDTIKSNKSYDATAKVTRAIVQAHDFNGPFGVIDKIRNQEFDIYENK